MSGNDNSFIKEMVDIFREQIEEYSVQLPELYKKGDYLSLSKVAHKAKSSVAVMGMTAVADKLKELELKAHDSLEVETYETIINEVLNQARLALIELDNELK